MILQNDTCFMEKSNYIRKRPIVKPIDVFPCNVIYFGANSD